MTDIIFSKRHKNALRTNAVELTEIFAIGFTLSVLSIIAANKIARIPAHRPLWDIDTIRLLTYLVAATSMSGYQGVILSGEDEILPNSAPDSVMSHNELLDSNEFLGCLIGSMLFIASGTTFTIMASQVDRLSIAFIDLVERIVPWQLFRQHPIQPATRLR